MNTFKNDLLKLYPELLHYARKLTRNEDNAKDLIQSTMLMCLVKEDQYTVDNLKAWCYTVMRNIFINEYRISRSRMERFYKIDFKYLNPTPESTDEEIIVDDLNKWVRKLSSKINSPLILMLEGYKYEEISKILNIPLHKVKSRIWWARHQLVTASEKTENKLKTKF